MDLVGHRLNKQLIAEKKVPSLFSVPTNDDGLPIITTRAEALKYCQNNYPNGQLPIVTATADWLTSEGRTLVCKKKNCLNFFVIYVVFFISMYFKMLILISCHQNTTPHSAHKKAHF